MKKQKTKAPARRSPVAQHMNTFCKAATMKNRKHDYQRTPKHRSRDLGVDHFRGLVLA